MNIYVDYVDKFKETIKKGEFKKYLGEKLHSETADEVYCAAIYQGYLDACRTFKENKLIENGERIKTLAKRMKDYLNNPGEEFKHKEYCDILIGENKMSFGQAQKIVNMAFKYLYCLVELSTDEPNYSSDMLKKFSACHMPLDGIMLEWLRRKDSTIKKTKIGAWSKMNNGENEEDAEGEYTYSFYCKKIDGICKKSCTTPLQLDFENWEEMSLILAAEEFLKHFDDAKIDENSTKQELYEQIKRIICK